MNKNNSEFVKSVPAEKFEPEIPDEMPDLWKILKDKGHQIEEISQEGAKKYVITGNKHYYVISDLRRRIVECKSCEVRHGGVLEAHKLHRYKVEDGVIYLDNEPINEIPEGFVYRG